MQPHFSIPNTSLDPSRAGNFTCLTSDLFQEVGTMAGLGEMLNNCELMNRRTIPSI